MMACGASANQDHLPDTRGVKNPKVIDLVKPESDSDSIVLQMIEDRPWPALFTSQDTTERLDELSEKFNNYLDYVIDGWFLQQYPQYEGKNIIFELSSKYKIPDYSKQVCEQMKRFAEKSGITLRITTECD
jgi:hypothetical protein